MTACIRFLYPVLAPIGPCRLSVSTSSAASLAGARVPAEHPLRCACLHHTRTASLACSHSLTEHLLRECTLTCSRTICCPCSGAGAHNQCHAHVARVRAIVSFLREESDLFLEVCARPLHSPRAPDVMLAHAGCPHCCIGLHCTRVSLHARRACSRRASA